MKRETDIVEFEGAAVADGGLIDRPIAETVNLLPIQNTPKRLRLREGTAPYVKLTPSGASSGLLCWTVPNEFRTGSAFIVLQNASDGKIVDISEYFEQVGRIPPSDPSTGGDLSITAPVLYAEAIWYDEIDLVWVETSGIATSFKLYRSVDPLADPATWTLVGTFPVGTVTYNDTGLDFGTTYYYYIKALIGTFASSASATVSATTFEGRQNPPYDLLVVAASRTSNVLTWHSPEPDEHFAPAAAIVVERYNPDTDALEEIARLAANAVTYTDTGLDPGTSYYYRVGADSEA